MHSRFLLTLSVVLLATIAGAQNPEQSWDNLKTLRVGEKIQVVDQKLKSLNGIFVSLSDEAISFRADKDDVIVQSAQVFRVSSRERGHGRGRNALIGLAVGAAAGAGLFGALEASSPVEDIPPGAAVAGGALLFGGVGAGVGAALPAGHPTAYRAERRKDQTAP